MSRHTDLPQPATGRDGVPALLRRLRSSARQQWRLLADEIAASRLAVDAYHAECRRNGR